MILATNLNQALTKLSKFKRPTLKRVGGYWIVGEKK